LETVLADLTLYLSDPASFLKMWLFIVLSLNALLGCYVLPTEAALKEGECEG